MFKEWGFLLTEIWVLLALAILLGLLAGWIIWGGRGDNGAAAEEVRRLRLALEKERARARASVKDTVGDVPPMQGGGYTRPTPPPKPTVQPIATPQPVPDEVDTAPAPVAPAPAPAPAPTPATQAAHQKPAGLDAPRDGLPDDLTQIKGIGAKLARLCNDLGFYHFDQIAAWTDAEIAWVDDNLEGFKGRVTRDKWVDQARVLAGPLAPAKNTDPSKAEDTSQPPAFVRHRD